MTNHMSFISAIARQQQPQIAIASLLEQINQRIPPVAQPPWVDVAFLFVTEHFTHHLEEITAVLRAALQPGVLLGCTSEGVIGSEQEVEAEPAISLAVAHLPDVAVTPFMLQPGSAEWHHLLLSSDEFRRAVGAPDDVVLFVLLADPFSTPIDDVLHSFNDCYPGAPVVGGMASGALRSGGNLLVVDDQLTTQGAVGVALSGALNVDIIVSQGCRPIWRPFKVDAAHRNVIYSLDGRPPLAWLQDLIPTLSEEDRALLQKGLFVGRAIRGEAEGKAVDSLGRGDFLIRGLVGIDQHSGAIAICDSVLEGERIQFHLRDALTAQEDLEMLLIPQAFRQPPCGGLVFTCNGRGTRLYDRPNGDISIIQRNIEKTNLAGFFCAGEIGPVGEANFLHGHTLSLALFRPAREQEG